jgi:hypothetical protein
VEDTNFTVTLPSNSNMNYHPTNSGNNYVVKLSSPLNFSGQTLNEDAAWEVAITTMQYTNRFYDLRENSTLNAVLEFNSAGAINTNVDKPKGVTELAATFGDANITDMTDMEKRILKTNQSHRTRMQKYWQRLGTTRIRCSLSITSLLASTCYSAARAI